MSDTKKPRVKIVLLYEGVVISTKYTMVHRWAVLPAGEDWQHEEIELDPEWRRTLWKKNLARHAAPGSVYRFDTDAEEPGDTIFVATAEYLGNLGNETLVRELQATSDIQRTEQRVIARERKNALRKQHIEALEPIRRAYWRMSGPEQAMLIAKVVRAITSPMKKVGKR